MCVKPSQGERTVAVRPPFLPSLVDYKKMVVKLPEEQLVHHIKPCLCQKHAVKIIVQNQVISKKYLVHMRSHAQECHV